jgi:hypothetical protein
MTARSRSCASIPVLALALALAGCLGGDDPDVALDAMPPDTYDNCGGGGLGLGVFSSSGGGVVSLGMTECELVKALGEPAQVSPNPGAPGTRRVTMVYENPDGTATSYLFVNNSLKEINRLTPGTPQAPSATPAPRGGG